MMSGKTEYITIENTQFNAKEVKKMSFAQFKKAYLGTFRKTSIEDAAELCGIKVPKSKDKDEN